MDNPDRREWGPPLALVVLGWAATVGVLAWCLLGEGDPASRLFLGVCVLVLAVCSLFGTRARPRLSASSAGIEVRGLAGAARYSWAQVTELRLLRTPGLARRSLTLEITVRTDDAPDGERLLIFGRLDLAADPRDVADQLGSIRP
ncbi:MAG TPA: PH domain-containing protein [Pseudonocardia sp.]